jgi:hypothetical protein
MLDATDSLHPAIGPETFHGELRRFACRLRRYNMRWHLAIFPRDLVRTWWKVDRCMPWPTSNAAYWDYKAGRLPRRRLFKGPSHFPQLRLIEGGAS